MQIRVEALREALELVKPAVPRKATIKSTRYVLLRDGKAVATDLDVAVELEVPGFEGEVLIPHKDALEALKRIPAAELLNIGVEGERLVLSWSKGKTFFEALDAEEFPPIPEVKGEEVSLDGDRLIKAMTSALPYCSKDDKARPVLAGILLSLGEKVEVVATDGFRMAYQQLPLTSPFERKVVVPGEAVKVLEHLWKQIPPAPESKGSIIERVLAKRELTLVLEQDKASFRFGRVAVLAKLIEGQYPNYREIMPRDDDWPKITFFAQDMEREVRRLREVNNVIRLSWENTTLRLRAIEEKKEAEGAIEAKAEAPGRIALDARYLLDYLKGKEGMVVMAVTAEKSPAVFRHSGSPLVVIMPMHVQW